MNNINKIRNISVWIFVIPLMAINLCWLMVVNWELFMGTILEVDGVGRLDFGIPYTEGKFSISRTARGYPTYLIFKPAMFLTSYLLIVYWNLNYKLINSFEQKKLSKYFRFFGISSAVFLFLHSIFLGITFDFEIYKIFRRFVILSFIIFELIAQAILVKNFTNIRDKLENLISKKVLKLKIALVITLIVVAFSSVPIVSSEGYDNFKHALEWNFFAAVVTFYLLTFFLWNKKK